MFWVLQSQILYLQIAYILYASGAGGGGVVDWIQDSTQEEKMSGGKPFVDGRDEARS
jgi:hypothetical protein